MKTQPKQTITKQEAVSLREFNGELMISSLMIADTTGKVHGNVIKSIESTFEKHSIDEKEFASTYVDGLNRRRKHYLLPKAEFELVVNRYSANHKAKLLAELDEYEANKKNLPSTTGDSQEGTSQLQTGKVLTLEEATSIREVDGEPVMSSFRISEVTGKLHHHVIRDIEIVFEESELESSKFECSYLSPQNKVLKMYLLPEREFNLIISGYSVKYRLVLIDELMAYREEKKANSPALPEDYLSALKALVVETEAKQAALIKIEKDKPKVEFATQVETSINSINIGTYAKVISEEHGMKIGQNKLFAYFRNKGILIKTGRRKNTPTQKYIANEYFEVKVGTYETPYGTKESITTLINGKGQVGLLKGILSHFRP